MQCELVEVSLVACITVLSVFFLFASLLCPHLRNEAAADGNRSAWWYNYVPTGELSDCRLLVCTHSILIAYNCNRQQYYQKQLSLSTGFMRYRLQSDMPQVKCKAYSSVLSKRALGACGIGIVVCICEKDRKNGWLCSFLRGSVCFVNICK